MSKFSQTSPLDYTEGRLYEPATISMITLGISAVSTIGGIAQGVSGSNKNAKLEADQNTKLKAFTDQARQFRDSIKKEEYDKLANADVNRALRDVSELMATRGMGLGSSAMAATTADASAAIRSGYGKQFLGDRNAAEQTYISALGTAAGAPMVGYNNDPWGDAGAGLKSLSSWASDNRFGLGTDPVEESMRRRAALGAK